MLRCFMDETITVVINEVNSIVGTLSCFVNTGMKDDADYINGTVHLAEHLIAKSIYLNNQTYAFTNANVDKEYMCIYGQALFSNFNDLLNAVININIDFSHDNIEREKQLIWNQENYKLLSNFRLLDMEKMEYNVFGEDNKLHMPTLVTRDDFFNIDDQMIKKYIREKICNSRVTYIFSVNPNNVDMEDLLNKVTKRDKLISTYDNGFYGKKHEELLCMQKRNTLQIKNYKPKFFMFAFEINEIKTIDEYLTINCLTILYRAVLNRHFEQTSNLLIDASLKIYDKTALLILYCKKRDDIYKVLSSIDLKNVSQVLDNVKRSILFSLIEKISTPIELHRYQFKTLKMFDQGKCFDVNELFDIFEKITLDKLVAFHKRCLASNYYQ